LKIKAIIGENKCQIAKKKKILLLLDVKSEAIP